MNELIGTVIKGRGAAADRFKECRSVLEKYGLRFPPLRFGTVNVKIDKKYKTPYYGVIIPYHLLDDISRMNKEYWQFIPIESINGKKAEGYILRTSINIHGEEVIELLAEDIGDEARQGNKIVVELGKTL
ncbi:hypothetical protein M0R36_08300 [bacterium]|jgi:hypothetical protein|nr:hypothetical protein [bacterium]